MIDAIGNAVSDEHMGIVCAVPIVGVCFVKQMDVE